MTALTFPFLTPLRDSDRNLARAAGCGGIFLLGLVVLFIALAVTGVALGLSPERLEAAQDLSSPGALIFVGVLLAGLGGLVLLAARLAYGRPFASFLWPQGFRLRLLLGGLLVAVPAILASVLVSLLVALATGEDIGLGDAADAGIPLLQGDLAYLGAAVLGMGLVALGEETIFRGVLLQVLAAWFRRGLPALVLGAILFSAVHGDPDPVAFGMRVLMGLTWGWATLRLGGVEFAVGLHFGNNLLLILLVPAGEALQTGREMPVSALVAQLAASTVAVAAVELMARRRQAPTAP
jgi:membrane protease YdiL (CAAX protease family)